MDYRGQTAVLSAILVLVGMFLVPAITEKALAVIHATAKGVCGPDGQTRPCLFSLAERHLVVGDWISQPTKYGTFVTWSTKGAGLVPDEKGSVGYFLYPEGIHTRIAIVVLSFENPTFGSNKCGITYKEGENTGGDCTAGKGMQAEFTYNLRVK